MSSQRNIDSLFRVQKPLVKRVRHTSAKDNSDEISASAPLQTPPPSKARRLSLTSTPSSKRKGRTSLSNREAAVPCTPPPPSTVAIAPPAAVTPTPKSVKLSKRVAKVKPNNSSNNIKGVRSLKLSTPSSTRSCRRVQQTLVPRPSPKSANPILKTPPLRLLRRSPRFAVVDDHDEQAAAAAVESGPVRPSRDSESDERRHEDEEIGPSHSPGNSHDLDKDNAADAKDEIGSVIDEDEDDEDDDDEAECEVRDDRLITPRSDPLLDHILDTFVDNPTV